jgi:hypothetical protein
MPPTVPAGGYELDALTDRERQIPLPMVNSIDLLFAQQIRALNQEQPVLMSSTTTFPDPHRQRQLWPDAPRPPPAGGSARQRGRHLSGHRVDSAQVESPEQSGERGHLLRRSIPHRFRQHLRQQQHRAHSRQRVPPPAGTTPSPTVPAGGPPHPRRSTRRHRSIHHRSRSARTASAQSCACSTLTTGAGNARSRPADTSAAISPYE